MNMYDCGPARRDLEDLLDGYLDEGDAAAIDHHLAWCSRCAAELERLLALRAALRAMPVPEPGPGFADAALATARRNAAPLPAPPVRRPTPAPAVRPWRRLETWLGAALGAAAAAALLALWWSPWQVTPREESLPGVLLALHEVREVALLIEAERPMPGATLSVSVSGGIALAGYENQREIRWQADLEQGANVLSLPIIALTQEAGSLSALVEHEARTQRIALAVRVVPSPAG